MYAKSEIGEKFAKFPLDNDSIDPLFQDDLADVHPLYRFKIKKALQMNLQEKESIAKYLPALQKSSEERIKLNKDYQNFLLAIENPTDNVYNEELYSQEDHQLAECMNIMKEFILLHDKDL